MSEKPPRIPLAVLRLLLPAAEREEVLADLEAEYRERASRDGPAAAGRWIRRQAFRSVRGLLGWTWRRSWTGHEPAANAYQPGGRMLRHWLTDARYAARRLRSRPGYTAVAVVTLALGIGGTAAVFGIARPLLFDPLPYRNAEGIGSFWQSGSWTEQEYSFLRGRFPGFDEVAAHRPGDVTFKNGDGPMRLVPGIGTSASLFDVLGVQPMLGRGFKPGDDVRGAEPVAVISYGFWRELGGADSIIGKRLMIDNAPRTIVGVMPKGFWYPTPAIRIWTAWAIDPERQNGSWTLIGRVSAGQDPGRMAPQVERLTRMLGERFTYTDGYDRTKGAWVKPVREVLLGSMQPALVATLVAMVLILLIACVNVTALMLGQVEGRSTELSVRSALGASRGRLTQQLVVEALLVGLLAAAVGGGLATLGFGVLARALPIGTWGETAGFDWTMFAVAFGTALVAMLAVVLVPVLSLWRGDLRGRIAGGRVGGIEGRGGRLESGLVVVEVALAMLIASGATLLGRSVAKLYAIDPGFESRSLAVVDVLASGGVNSREAIRVIDELTLALNGIPGVKSVAAAVKIPLRGSGDSFGVAVEGEPERNSAYFRIVSANYFETMGIRMLAGRTFTDADRAPPGDSAGPEIPIVINEALARKFFPGQDPLGRRLVGGASVPQRIIGIVANVAEGGLTDPPDPTRYYFHRQFWLGPRGTLVIKTARPQDAAVILSEARRIVERVAPGFAVQGTTTMERVLDNAVGPARQVMVLLGLLSGLALILGAVGIYGVIAHFAARRRRDWAIRVALGLAGSRVVTQIVRQGAVLAAIGIGFGALAAAGLTRLLSSLLYGVTGTDPVAFAMASAAILAIGLGAAFIPAWRTGTVDPATVLREQ